MCQKPYMNIKCFQFGKEIWKNLFSLVNYIVIVPTYYVNIHICICIRRYKVICGAYCLCLLIQLRERDYNVIFIIYISCCLIREK